MHPKISKREDAAPRRAIPSWTRAIAKAMGIDRRRKAGHVSARRSQAPATPHVAAAAPSRESKSDAPKKESTCDCPVVENAHGAKDMPGCSSMEGPKHTKQKTPRRSPRDRSDPPRIHGEGSGAALERAKAHAGSASRWADVIKRQPDRNPKGHVRSDSEGGAAGPDDSDAAPLLQLPPPRHRVKQWLMRSGQSFESAQEMVEKCGTFHRNDSPCGSRCEGFCTWLPGGRTFKVRRVFRTAERAAEHLKKSGMAISEDDSMDPWLKQISLIMLEEPRLTEWLEYFDTDRADCIVPRTIGEAVLFPCISMITPEKMQKPGLNTRSRTLLFGVLINAAFEQRKQQCFKESDDESVIGGSDY